MTAAKQRLTDKLYRGIDPFTFFAAEEAAVDTQGWGSRHKYLSEAIEFVNPSVVIEVGVWKGGSVLEMASRMRELDLDAVVIAVDTWRGSAEHWIKDEWFPSLRIKGGISHIQETFMSNVVSRSLGDYVLPLPLDSVNAFSICKRLKVVPDVIHIDAGHDYDSVSTDLRIWWSLLRPGGVMICDDFSLDEDGNPRGWIDVAKAVKDHIDNVKKCINFKHRNNKCWMEKA